MMMLKKTLLCMMLSATLSGCTELLWKHNSSHYGASLGLKTTRTEYQKEVVGNDNIRAFALVKPDSKTLPANSLVMMGERYWYVILHPTSSELIEILRTPVSQHFDILAREPGTRGTHRMESMNIYLRTDNKQIMSQNEQVGFVPDDFCLQYMLPEQSGKAVQQKEQAALEKLGFEFKDNRGRYCPHVINGILYAAPENLPAEYQFGRNIRSIPVNLVFTNARQHTDWDGKMLLRNIVLTPFTVAGDIVLLPLLGVGALVKGALD